MDVQLMDIGMKVREIVMYTSRCGYRSVCSHPFLVGLLCFLMCLQRLFPFIFALLVSASPVLVCTAILLGILLSFGQPNIPEIETEDRTTTYEAEAVLIKTGESRDAVVVKKNEEEVSEDCTRVDLLAVGELAGFVSEDTVPLIGEGERSRDVELNVEEGWEFEKGLGDLGNDEKVELIGEKSLEAELNKDECWELKRGLGDLGNNKKVELIGERSLESELSNGESWESKRGLGDLGNDEEAEWDGERHNEVEVVENHYAPIPLVDDQNSSSDDEKSEAESFGSEKVNVDTLDSPLRSPWAQVVNREEVEEGEDADFGSDCAESSSPDASMADIMPMLDELHPLLDQEASRPGRLSLYESDTASERPLKSSTSSQESDNEGENHNRLNAVDNGNEDEEGEHGGKEEGRKSAFIWTEDDQKNLMDLGSSEIERNLRLESLILRRRARKNMNMLPERDLIDLEGLDFPFNVAPISTRRHNPFDNPQDSQDNLGLPPIPGSAPSVLLPRRNPFDMPYDSREEKLSLSGGELQTDFTASQSRELFRSHQSFNVRPSLFARDGDAVKIRPCFVPDQTISEESSNSLLQTQSSEISEFKESSVPETKSISSEEDNSGKAEAVEPTKECTEENVHQECGLTSVDESVSEHVRHGSESLIEGSSELGQTEKAEFEDDEELKAQLHYPADHYQQEGATQNVELVATECHFNSGRSSSSSSSLSEESERVFTEIESRGLLILEERNDVAEETGFTTQASVESNELSITSALAMANDNPYGEPVYDYSPLDLQTQAHVSSFRTSGVLRGSDPEFPPMPVKRTESFIERESELAGNDSEIETSIPRSVEVLPESSSVADPLDELRPADNVDLRDCSSATADLSCGEQAFNDESPDTISYRPVSSEVSNKASTEENITVEHNFGEVSTSTPSDDIIHSLDDYSECQELDQTMVYKQHQQPTETNGEIENVEPLPEDRPNTLHFIGIEESMESVVVTDADANSEAKESLISSPDEGNASTIVSDRRQEQFSVQPNEGQASSAPVKLVEDDHTVQESHVPEVQELDHSVLSYDESPLSPDFTSLQSSAFEVARSQIDLQTIVEEVDEIKEIDGLLSELENVGDFSINQCGFGLNELEKYEESVGVSKTEDTLHLDIQSIDNLVDLSKMKFSKSNGGEDSFDQEASKAAPMFVENEVCVEIQSAEYVKPVSKEINLTSVGTEHMLGDLEVSYQVDDDTRMPELEASTIEDIELAFKKISAEGIEKADLQTSGDSPGVEMVPVEDVEPVSKEIDSTSVENKIVLGDVEVSYQVGDDARMLELEARTTEDIELAFKKISAEGIDNVVLQTSEDSPAVEMVPVDDVEPVSMEIDSTTVENKIVLGDVEVCYQVGDDARMPELEASTIEDIELVFKKISAEGIEKAVLLTSGDSPAVEMVPVEDVEPVSKEIDSTSVENKMMLGDVEVSYQVGDDTRMPEVEASIIEEMDPAFKKISADGIEKAVLQTSGDIPVSEMVPRNDVETVSKEINLASVGTENMLGDVEVSSQVEDDTGMPELEASTIEDIDLAFKKISDEGIKKAVLQPSGDSPVVEDASDNEKSSDGIGSSSGEITGNASVPSEPECPTTSPSKQQKIKSSVEVEEDNIQEATEVEEAIKTKLSGDSQKE